MSLGKKLVNYCFITFWISIHCVLGQEMPSDSLAIKNGKLLFKGNCAQCHAVHKKIIGPPLAGVYERQSIPWLLNFIKYPERTIKSGDEHAVAMYEEYKQLMPNHDFFKDEDILSILAYVKDETIKGSTETSDAETTEDIALGERATNTTLLKAIILGLSIVVVLLLIIMIFMLSTLSRNLKNSKNLSKEDSAYVGQRFSVLSIIKSPYFINIVTLIFIALVGKVVIEGLFSVGVQQGYAPEQPIKFSHKLHAGYYEIDCKYCHTGVEKSKNANIPSANICMNCHNTIRNTSSEIQKIYTAIENDQPIQWVRVHNLPDLAYFNHSQHVKVGGLACESCHGDIKEMEVVQQFSLLTMGWCIDCHRKTKLNIKDNDYYSKLIRLHENKNIREPLKVEDIGGLECAKCHY